MRHLQTYENWRTKVEYGWVINGISVIEKDKQDVFDRFENLFNISDNDIMLPISYIWSGWIPGIMFQCPVKTKEKAIEISEEIIKQLDTKVAIAISEGEMMMNYDDPMNCDGDAYINSGRYITKNYKTMLDENEQIKII